MEILATAPTGCKAVDGKEKLLYRLHVYEYQGNNIEGGVVMFSLAVGHLVAEFRAQIRSSATESSRAEVSPGGWRDRNTSSHGKEEISRCLIRWASQPFPLSCLQNPPVSPWPMLIGDDVECHLIPCLTLPFEPIYIARLLLTTNLESLTQTYNPDSARVQTSLSRTCCRKK